VSLSDVKILVAFGSLHVSSPFLPFPSFFHLFPFCVISVLKILKLHVTVGISKLRQALTEAELLFKAQNAIGDLEAGKHTPVTFAIPGIPWNSQDFILKDE
jgi:hypothetical protein